MHFGKLIITDSGSPLGCLPFERGERASTLITRSNFKLHDADADSKVSHYLYASCISLEFYSDNSWERCNSNFVVGSIMPRPLPPKEEKYAVKPISQTFLEVFLYNNNNIELINSTSETKVGDVVDFTIKVMLLRENEEEYASIRVKGDLINKVIPENETYRFDYSSRFTRLIQQIYENPFSTGTLSGHLYFSNILEYHPEELSKVHSYYRTLNTLCYDIVEKMSEWFKEKRVPETRNPSEADKERARVVYKLEQDSLYLVNRFLSSDLESEKYRMPGWPNSHCRTARIAREAKDGWFSRRKYTVCLISEKRVRNDGYIDFGSGLKQYGVFTMFRSGCSTGQEYRNVARSMWETAIVVPLYTTLSRIGIRRQ